MIIIQAYLVSDNIDTLVGMRLAGIDGVVVHEKHEILGVLQQLLENKDIALILITQKNAALVPEFINEQKMTNNLKLIVEIPDRHGSGRSEDYILSYVRDAIGVKI